MLKMIEPTDGVKGGVHKKGGAWIQDECWWHMIEGTPEISLIRASHYLKVKLSPGSCWISSPSRAERSFFHTLFLHQSEFSKMLNANEDPFQFNPNRHWIQTRIEAASVCLVYMKFWAPPQHHIKQVVCICNPGSGEVEARESEVQGQSQLHGELEVSLGYTRPCLCYRSPSLWIQRESWYVFSLNRQ